VAKTIFWNSLFSQRLVGGWHTCIQPTVLVCSVISQMNTVQLHAQAQ